MAYIGREPHFGAFETQNLVGNGSDTQFTLNFPTTTTSSIAVWVNKVSQVPEVDYNVTTSTIQFTVAPGNGVQIKILYLGRQHLVGEVANNSITENKIANNSITSSKIDIFKDTPDASSIYEINDSTTNGVLIAPKMTQTQRDAISSPATALVIYNTTTNKLNIYNGTSWKELGGSLATTAMDLSESNASDIFTNFVKDMEDHGRTALNTEKGFVDELEASDDMIDESNSANFNYDATNDFYESGSPTNNIDSDKSYTTESNYIQQEWTNSNQSTSQVNTSIANDPRLKLLLHLDNTFTDSSVNNFSTSNWTTTSAVSFSSSVKQFGTHSLEFNSGGGNTQRFAHSSTTSLADDILNSSTWTIEMWAMWDFTLVGGDQPCLLSIAPEGVWNSSTVPTASFDASVFGVATTFGADSNVGTKFQFQANTNGTAQVANQWRHYAFVRDGSNFYCFVGGVLLGTKTNFPSLGTSTNAKFQLGERGVTHNHTIFGNNNTSGQKAYIDEFRISTKVEYTSNFTPISSAFPGSQFNSATLSSGSWPTNSKHARISFDTGSTWFDVEDVISNTQLALTTLPSPAIVNSDYILRMSEFDAGVVQLTSYGVNSFGPDLTSTSFALASSGNRAGHSTTGAVDNSTTVTWVDNKGSNLWWSIDFGSGVTKRIQKYTLVGKHQAGNPSGNDTMRDWKLEGSNDNTNWTTVDTRTGTTTWVDQAKTDYTSMNGTVGDFRYYRIFITANNSGVAICGIVELELMELSNPQPTNPTTEYVSIADLFTQTEDVTNWSDINSSSITEILNSQNAYYWFIFEPTNNYGPDTEVKIFHQGGSVWRTIAKNNAGTWEYNSSTTAATFTGTSATTNDMLHAVSQALSTVSDNRMTKAEIEAITDAEFELSNGFTTSDTLLARGVTLVSSSSIQNPKLSLFRVNYDEIAGALDLRTKQWTGTSGTPSAPATSPDTMYLFVVDEITSGTPVYAVTRDGGTTYTNATFNASWVFNGTKVAKRATIDVSGQPAGTDPRLKITGLEGNVLKIHAVGLQTK